MSAARHLVTMVAGPGGPGMPGLALAPGICAPRLGGEPVGMPRVPGGIAACEALAALGRPDGLRPRVRAVALNSALLDAEAAAEQAKRLASETRLPVLDPVRAGAERLLDAVLAKG